MQLTVDSLMFEPGMDPELVNIRVHYGNGYITFRDYGVDLSNYPYLDTTLRNPIMMRREEVLAWLHNLLQVNPLQQRLKISGVIPREREHGWKWELQVMRNTKCWRTFVHMAVYAKYKFPLVLVVEGELVNSIEGESSMAVAEQVDENVVSHGPEAINEVDMGEDARIIAQERPEDEDDDADENSWSMDVDAGEVNEAIVDELELGDDEYRTFVDGGHGSNFDDETCVPEE